MLKSTELASLENMARSAPRLRIARFGLFEADLERRVLSKEGLRLKLQDQPFQLLALLLERPCEVVTREEIQQKLWPADTYVAFDDGLNTAMKKLRLAVGDSADNPRFIETIPRRGYRFLVAPNFEEKPAEPELRSEPAKPISKDVSEGVADTNGNAVEVTGESKDCAERGWARRWAAAIVACAVLVTGSVIWHTRGHRVSSSSASHASGRAQRGGRSRRSVDPRAHEEYLQARNYWKQRTAEALSEAVNHFNLAIELDPDYAEAYAGLANCYVVFPMTSTVRTNDDYLKARQAAEKAIALDDSLAEAHLAAAEVKLYSDWDFPGAEKEFQRAIELDSGDAQAHQWFAEFLSLMGRHGKAIAEIQKAQQLDPSSMIIHHQAGQILQAARMYSEALLEYKRALMIEPGFGPTYSAMGLAYRRQGRYAECLEAERQANLYWDPGGTAVKDLQSVADAYRSGGKRAFLRASLEFDKKHPGQAYYFGHDYALLGEDEQVLLWLQKSFAAHELEILNVQNDPEFEHLTGDPRFQEIVKKVGLTLNMDTTESLPRR